MGGESLKYMCLPVGLEISLAGVFLVKDSMTISLQSNVSKAFPLSSQTVPERACLPLLAPFRLTLKNT